MHALIKLNSKLSFYFQFFGGGGLKSHDQIHLDQILIQ